MKKLMVFFRVFLVSMMAFVALEGCTVSEGTYSPVNDTVTVYPTSYYGPSPYLNTGYGWSNGYWSGYRGVPGDELEATIW